MYTVMIFDDGACDDVEVFSGSLEECKEYIATTDEYIRDDYFIVDEHMAEVEC